MLNEGLERDNIHFNISEDDGFNVPINCILSPREPGKTTSMMLDKVYSAFKRDGLPSVVLVNNAIDVNEAYLASFEEQINEFKGYEIHTTYPKSAKETVTIIKEKETGKPFVYVIPLNTPKTRLKRLVLGKCALMWYDECNVDISLGEKWPDNVANKWNELYTTLARKSYPKHFKFYMTGNFYTRYNPILVYLGVDCNKLEIGKKLVHKQVKDVNGVKLDFSTLVDCYQLKPELREFILQHNPGYHFDDTYERYFKGEAIADLGLPIEIKKPEGFGLRYCFKISTRYLWVWQNNSNNQNVRYWLEVKGEPCGKRTKVFCISMNDLMSNAFLAKSFKTLFIRLQFAMSTMNLSFQSPEAFYLMQQVSCVI